MIGFPHKDMKEVYAFITRQTKDRESKEDFAFPVEYMFKQVPEKEYLDVDDPISVTLHEMDRWGVEKGVIGVGDAGGVGELALKRHPDRFIPQAGADPNEGMEAVRKIVRAYETYGVRSVSMFPAGTFPQVAINDKKMYPIYAKCVELGVPIIVYAGVPGPRILMSPQEVGLLDEVCWFFPELKVVVRHGAEPWTELMVKLLLKWPNLYYSTSAFAPKHYPADIVNFANTRGADKILYAGYYSAGLGLDRIFAELPGVPFRDHVWPKFLRENAVRVFGLEDRVKPGEPA
jgi:predicted TIM-barrel fold metal-dependent hydrolase